MKHRKVGTQGVLIAIDLIERLKDKSGLKYQITIDLLDRSIIKLKGYDADSNIWFLINVFGSIITQTGNLIEVLDITSSDYRRLKKIHDKALDLQLQLRSDPVGGSDR